MRQAVGKLWVGTAECRMEELEIDRSVAHFPSKVWTALVADFMVAKCD